MRIESRELSETPESRAELRQLADELRAEGFEVSVAEPGESVKARLQEGLGADTVDVLNVILDEAARTAIDVALLATARRLRDWARRRRLFGLGEADHDVAPVAVIWGPDGDVLQVVELPPPGSNLTSDERRVLGGLLGGPGAAIAEKTAAAVADRIAMAEAAVRRTLAQLADLGLVHRDVDATTGVEFWVVLEPALERLEGAVAHEADED